MLQIRNVLTLYQFIVRALQTKLPSGMLLVGIEPTGMILHNTNSIELLTVFGFDPLVFV